MKSKIWLDSADSGYGPRQTYVHKVINLQIAQKFEYFLTN
jgi:hypothetical protein